MDGSLEVGSQEDEVKESKGDTPNVRRARRETKSDECKQRPNEVGVGVSNIKTKVIEYMRVILIYL